MDTDSAASDSAPASPGASAAPVAMGHSPPRVTGASAYTSYFSRLSQLLSVSVKHYLPGTAAGSGAVDVPAPVAASDRLLGCSLQRGLRRHACSCARNRAHAAGDATTDAPPATCCAAGCGAAGRHAGGSDAYKLYMCMCYTSGFQVWAVDGAGNGSTGAGGGAGAGAGIGPGHPLAPSFREVLSIRDQKAVRRMKIIATPCVAACMRHPDAGDSPSLLHEMPLVATLSAKADPEFPLTAVRLHSLRSGKAVHTLRMDAPVHDVVSSPDTVVVCMEASLALLNPLTLQRLHTIPCYPMPAAMAAVALGDRWLAYGAVELPPAPTQGDGNGTGHSGTGDDSGSGSGGVGKVRSASMDDDEADGGLWGVWSVAKGVASGLYGLKGVGEQTLSLVRTVGGAVAGAAGVGATAPLPPLPPTTASGAPPVPPPAAADASSASGPASGSKKARPPPRKAAGCVVVRDSATQRVVAHFRSHYSPLVAMAFDASGSILATVAVEGQTIHVHQLLPAEAGAGSGVTPGIEAAWRRPGEGPTRQQRLLFRLERGLTHALVSSLKFSSGGAWLAATSAHGTTHLFSLSTRQYERAGGPPGAGGSPEAPRSEVDATPDVASVAVAPPPLPDAGAGDGGGALSGLASRFGAVLGLGRGGGSDAASGVTPSMAEYPAAISQQSYLAAWEQRQARAAGPVVRGACLRVRHVSAQADRTDGASAAHGGGAAPGATGGSGADGASGATGAAPTSGTGGAEGVEEDSGVSHPSMCSAVFAGTTSQHLVAASWGLLSVYELGVDEAASAAAEGADGGQVATSQQRGVWDMGRRADWGEVHQPAAILHASWTPPSRSHDARRGSRATAVTEELRAHWLSHADIHTHTQPVLPLWASPLFIMHKLQSKTPPLAADATHPPAQRRNGPSGPSGRRRSRGSRSRRGSDSSAPTQPVAQPAASSSQRPAPMTMEDLFLDTSSSVPVTVRRAGPRPVVPAPGDPVMSGAVIMDDHFSPTHAREPPRAHQAAPQPQRPAPSAPPLAVSIRQALETPLADSFAPGDVDPPTDAPAMQASGPPSVHSSVRSGPSRRSSYDSGGSDSRDGARSVESGLMLALSSQQSDYFADQARAREAAIAQHHTDAVQSNAAAAAALFGGASPGSPAERPHLLTDDDDVTGSAILGERARVPAASSDEPPPPSASPRGSTPGTVPSRNSDGHGSANAWGAQDAEWLDSELGVASERHGRAAPRRAAPVPVGNKVAFDASRPNVASSDDDDDV